MNKIKDSKATGKELKYFGGIQQNSKDLLSAKSRGRKLYHMGGEEKAVIVRENTEWRRFRNFRIVKNVQDKLIKAE